MSLFKSWFSSCLEFSSAIISIFSATMKRWWCRVTMKDLLRQRLRFQSLISVGSSLNGSWRSKHWFTLAWLTRTPIACSDTEILLVACRFEIDWFIWLVGSKVLFVNILGFEAVWAALYRDRNRRGLSRPVSCTHNNFVEWIFSVVGPIRQVSRVLRVLGYSIDVELYLLTLEHWWTLHLLFNLRG